MKLTHRGEIVLAILGITVLSVLIAVAVLEPRAAGAILALMALWFFGILMGYVTSQYKKAGDIIEGSRRMAAELEFERDTLRWERNKNRSSIH